MLQRIVSALFALLIILPILMWGGVVGVQGLVGFVLLVVLYEFAPVASPKQPRGAFAAMAVVGLSLYAWMALGPIDARFCVALVLGVALLLTWAMFVHVDPVDGATEISYVAKVFNPIFTHEFIQKF